MYILPQPSALSRRSFLRGVGVTIALPLLEAMRPAFSRAAAPAAPLRGRGPPVFAPPAAPAAPLGWAATQPNRGIIPPLFFPERAGRDYDLSPYLKLLEPLRPDFTVFSGLSHPGVDGGHANEVSF